MKQVIKQILESHEDLVEGHISAVRIPAEKLAKLFGRDATFTEIEEAVSTMSRKLT